MNTENISRRSAIKGSFAIGAASLLSSKLNAAVTSDPISLKKGDTILFQGDSITDAGRNKGDAGANSAGGLGNGYPFLIGSYLLMRYPALGLKVYNRGISGHKVPDLDNRWDKDCIDMKPAVLSILIGVNDIWHKLNGKYDGTVETYETGFAALLEKTKAALPDTRIVVCDPFVTRCGAVNDTWFPEFTERRAAARKVAEAAGTQWVPFQEMFDAATNEETKANYWAGDGVHPSVAGHALMTAAWLKSTGLE